MIKQHSDPYSYSEQVEEVRLRKKEHDVKLCSETQKCKEKFVNNERLTVNKEVQCIRGLEL